MDTHAVEVLHLHLTCVHLHVATYTLQLMKNEMIQIRIIMMDETQIAKLKEGTIELESQALAQLNVAMVSEQDLKYEMMEILTILQTACQIVPVLLMDIHEAVVLQLHQMFVLKFVETAFSHKMKNEMTQI